MASYHRDRAGGKARIVFRFGGKQYSRTIRANSWHEETGA
jgi:hypothetical protein